MVCLQIFAFRQNIIVQQGNMHSLNFQNYSRLLICFSFKLLQLSMGLQFLVQIPRQHKKKYTTNYISTTKYNIFTFLPIALLLQFKRYANIYFLICAIMQSIPLISPLNPASAVLPLIFVLALSVARQGFEDYKRWKSDKQNNKSITHIYVGNQLKIYQWKKIRQGDIVKLQKDEIVPADIIVLMSSQKTGISYVETSSLDGQKNLKPKLSLTQTQLLFNKTQQIPDFHLLTGKIKCSEPCAENIESFQARVDLQLKLQPNHKIQCDINKKYILHRGSRIKNTDWVIGIAAYCGKDTAIMMNGSEPFTKTSNIQLMVNKTILLIFTLELLCSLGSAIFCYVTCLQTIPFLQIIYQGSVDCLYTAGISFASYFILYSTFIPISLIVSLQFVKVFQGLIMSRDKQLYCGHNQRYTQCHTVSINEELGQIQYILTDKTGTLTCNKMQFRNIVIGSYIYGEELILNEINQNFDYSQLSNRRSASAKLSHDQKINFNSKPLQVQLGRQQESKQNKGKMNKKMIQQIFFMIATCHQCIKSGDHYQGPSPDQVALLNAAKKIGFQFISTQNMVTNVQYKNKKYQFKILKVIEFDSVRKRMSVVLKTKNIIKVYVKGADTSIEPLLAKKQIFIDSIREKTNQMTRTGLRSLWFAYKELSLDTDIGKLTSEELESNLQLLGATGIQDKLQDYVPQTIHALRQGGIKFIMLTGDKLQTAQNIAISCRLIEQGYLINGIEMLNQFTSFLRQKYNTQSKINISIISKGSCVYASPVIDGSTLNFQSAQEQLLYIIPRVKSMVFCRVTPKQKAQIVKLVKKLGKLTLAIGDGANDVNMILEAHVGIGIFGQQGTRAAQVSNYAIGEFCILWKLLLYYGRLNYMRVSEMILYFFYKNMVFTIVQFAYCFYNNGSGQSFWLSWSITFYNMVFTFFPVVLRAVFEVDLDIVKTKRTFKQLSQGTHSNQLLYSYYPKMYLISQKNELFTKFIFFSWFFLGVCQGVICLMITLYTLGDPNDTSGVDSYQSGLYFAEISAYTSVIIIVTVKLAINVKNWNIILVLGFLIPSVGAYIFYMFLTNTFSFSTIQDYTAQLLKMPSFYLAQILCIMGMFCFDFLLFSIQSTKSNFQNYLKFRTIRNRNLSISNLNTFMMEMQTTQERCKNAM